MKLTSADYDSSSNDSLLYDVGKYQRMVEKLLYLTNTRFDIAFAVQTLSQYMQKSKMSHWNAVLRVIKYIKGNLGLGLLMSLYQDPTLTGYCDADWTACLSTKR